MAQQDLIVNATLAVFACVAAGTLARKAGWLKEAADSSLLKITLNVLIPCLIFSEISDNPALQNVRTVALAPAVGCLVTLLGFFLAWLVGLLGPSITGMTTQKQRFTFAVSIGIFNYGYVPLPLIKFLFKDDPEIVAETIGVMFIHNVGVDIAIWTVGILLLSGKFGRDSWRHMINAPFVTIFVALAVNFLQLHEKLPTFFVDGVEMLGEAGIPMALLLIGATIADQFHPEGALGPTRTIKLVSWSCILRLAILPVCFLILGYYLPAPDSLKRVIAIEAAMPAAVFPIILARHYGGDPSIATRVTIGTSLVGLVTIPLWINFGLRFLGFGE